MPLELHESSATLTEVVTVDEVEQLATWLRSTPKAKVNLRRCNHLHTGALQLLLLFRPKVTAAPTEAFLATQVLPLLEGGNGSAGRKEPEPP